jgi:hypothetical protein
MKPCMIIWPANVPTAELEIPDAMGDQEHACCPNTQQGRQRVVGRFDLRNITVSSVERARCHHYHRHIDQAGGNQCDDDFPIGEAQHLAALVVVMDRRARLRQSGMQIDGVRHDGCADDADGEQQCLAIG